jgi:integrase/recombinase XerD
MELPHLALYDIDRHRALVMVREGKGRRDRVVPIGARALAWVEAYLSDSRPLLQVGAEEALFLTDYGAPMTPEILAAKVKRYLRLAGLHRIGSCHLLRHAMATHMLDNGADIRFIQAMLGHADLATTQIYTQVSVEKLKEIHAATHPARLERAEPAAAADTDLAPAEPRASAQDALYAALDAEAHAEDEPSL